MSATDGSGRGSQITWRLGSGGVDGLATARRTPWRVTVARGERRCRVPGSVRLSAVCGPGHFNIIQLKRGESRNWIMSVSMWLGMWLGMWHKVWDRVTDSAGGGEGSLLAKTEGVRGWLAVSGPFCHQMNDQGSLEPCSG